MYRNFPHSVANVALCRSSSAKGILWYPSTQSSVDLYTFPRTPFAISTSCVVRLVQSVFTEVRKINRLSSFPILLFLDDYSRAPCVRFSIRNSFKDPFHYIRLYICFHLCSELQRYHCRLFATVWFRLGFRVDLHRDPCGC